MGWRESQVRGLGTWFGAAVHGCRSWLRRPWSGRCRRQRSIPSSYVSPPLNKETWERWLIDRGVWFRQVMMFADSREEVLQTEYLVGEILRRSRGSTSFLCATHVNRLWRSTARIPMVLSGFISRNELCFIGFILEYGGSEAPAIRLITPPITSDKDPAIELQNKFVSVVFHEKRIVGVYGRRVIVQFGSGPRAGKLYENCPYSFNPWKFKKATRPIPSLGLNLLDNRYGQFAVLGATNGLAGGYPVCFLKDYSKDYRANYQGVYFETVGRIFVHVSVYIGKKWIPHVFGPLTAPSRCIF